MRRSSRLLGAAVSTALAIGFLGGALPVQAQEHGPEHGGERGGPREGLRGAPREGFRGEPGRFDGHGQILDGRYNHGRYYPAFGSVVHDLPGGYHPYYFRGSPFYFAGGIWYAPGPAGFLVVRPPIGLTIAVLPPYYSTVWFGGVPYYYADDVYYTWDPTLNAYQVVAPPPNADQPSPPPVAPSEDLMIYPKNGQTQEQQAADRYECHNWAKGQTGFDPTQPDGGVPPDQNASARANYNRAMSACLQARGYQVS
jgi:hypothetical protein